MCKDENVTEHIDGLAQYKGNFSPYFVLWMIVNGYYMVLIISEQMAANSQKKHFNVLYLKENICTFIQITHNMIPKVSFCQHMRAFVNNQRQAIR